MTTRFVNGTDEAPPRMEAVAGRLLEYLRATTGDATLDYRESPKRITGGFDTTILSCRLSGARGDLAEPLIVRIFRPDVPGEQVRFEGAMQEAVRAGGFPAPRVVLSCTDPGVLGGPFVVMERLAGRVMLDALFRPGLQRVPVAMARLHAQLHALDPDHVWQSLTRAGIPRDWVDIRTTADWARSRIDAASLDGLRPGFDWIVAGAPPPPARPSVCHGDFHPINIMVDGRTISGVLDWSWARVDDPAWDVGASVALFTLGPVHVPGVLRPLVALIRRWLVARYLSTYVAERPLDMDLVHYYEAMRCLACLVEAGEHMQAARGRVPAVDKPSAFAETRVQQAIIARFRKISGIALSLPA